ncbi:hypothetical protein [Luteimonas fraxinea]|uniref:hypothetical protein n=1 Tax=Luteimonas fraxinea TaxID=2901869 RepID=UPI001E57DEEC|nr:hypothetical protein [Luteimonas fraxinea]
MVLIRSMGGSLFWLDAQRWCVEHPDRLAGAGYRAVRFDRDSALAEREPFEAFLQKAFLTTASRQVEDMSGPTSVDRQVSALLSRATGSPPGSAGSRLEGALLPENAENLQIKFLAGDSAENRKRLREAIALGLPRTVDVNDFRIARGAADAPIGPLSGRMTLSSQNVQPTRVLLYPGTRPSLTAMPLNLPAERFQGLQYAAFSNERLSSLFNFAMSPGQHYPAKADIDISFGLRNDALTNKPLRQCHELGPLADWAEQMLSKGDAHIELGDVDSPAPITLPPAFVDHFAGVIRMAWALGRLHAVTRVLRSDFALPQDFELTERSLDDIGFAYRLLRGDRIAATPGVIEFDPAVAIDLSKQYEMQITTNFMVSVAGRQVGLIPAVVQLQGFQIGAVSGTSRVRLEGDADSRALVYYSEHGDEDSMMQVPPQGADS